MRVSIRGAPLKDTRPAHAEANSWGHPMGSDGSRFRLYSDRLASTALLGSRSLPPQLEAVGNAVNDHICLEPIKAGDTVVANLIAKG